MGAFFTSKRSRTGNLVLVTKRGIGSVIAQKQNQGILGNSQCIKMIEQVAQRLIHPFDQCRKGLRILWFTRINIVLGKTRIGMKGSFTVVFGRAGCACRFRRRAGCACRPAYAGQIVSPKKRNIDAVMAKVAAGKIDLHLGSHMKSIGTHEVTFVTGAGDEKTVRNDHVFEMIGAELPLGFFKKVGIQLEQTWHWKRWAVLLLIFFCVYSLYSLKSFGKDSFAGWPYEAWISKPAFDSGLRTVFEWCFLPFAWLFSPDAYQDILHGGVSGVGYARDFQKGYLYSLLYTLLMVVFGWEAMIRWRGYARDKRYFLC